MEGVKSLSDRYSEPKRWGWEEWIVNNEMYCGKRLHFNVFRGSTSLHFHVSKHETMYVESGSFEIVTVDTSTGFAITNYLNAGDSIVIPKFMPHRIIATTVPAVLVEFSTHHRNDDSYRVDP
jgi:oxalate decarboxylase/phosphoglucose isomerase-like protein (cupin superfamily)